MPSPRYVIATSLLLIGVLACAKPPIPIDPRSETPAPIPLDDAGSHTLIFKKVVFRIASGSVLGETRLRNQVVNELRWTRPSNQTTEFNVGVTDGLRARGYDVRDIADSIFEPAGHAKVRYELAAVLHDVDLDFEYSFDRRHNRPGVGVGTAKVELEIQLYDSVENTTVYSHTFTGFGKDKGLKPTPIVPAVVDAVLKITTDPAFVRIVSIGKNPSDPTATDERFEIAKCPMDKDSNLPKGLPEMLRAVVEIQVGGLGGTGVIISPDGWVVTAAHVVKDATEIWVRLASGAQIPARAHRIDTRSDVALLRIPGREYPCAQLRDGPGDLGLGSDLFAINIAIDDSHTPTITRGVVSGFPEQEGTRYIQTDASVNPGSSGGPLFSRDGFIAGITVSKIVGPGIEGLGLAVPIDDVVRHLSIRLKDD